ncbi:unnamed protein product [Mucor hiemalis]
MNSSTQQQQSANKSRSTRASSKITPIVTQFEHTNLNSDVNVQESQSNSNDMDPSASEASAPSTNKGYRFIKKPATTNTASAVHNLSLLIDNLHIRIAQLATVNFGTPEYQQLVELTTELSQRQQTLTLLQGNVRPQQQESIIAPPTTTKSQERVHLFVPPQLPFIFQWQNFMVDGSKPRFSTLQDCFRHFESIVKMHNLDIDVHGKRLLPPCLSTDLQAFLDDFINNTTGGRPSWDAIKGCICI